MSPKKRKQQFFTLSFLISSSDLVKEEAKGREKKQLYSVHYSFLIARKCSRRGKEE
jgi:hypothetical protein